MNIDIKILNKWQQIESSNIEKLLWIKFILGMNGEFLTFWN